MSYCRSVMWSRRKK